MDNKKYSFTFLVLAVSYSVFLILANILEVKVVNFGIMTATAGLIIFPMSYIINDCIVEIYGFRRAKMTIWLGFIMNLFAVLVLQLAIILPPDPLWEGQDSFYAVFGNSWRILLASFTAMICGSMINAYIMSKMKLSHKGKNFSLRAIVSTIGGELVDSTIFFPIAFWGILPKETIFVLIFTQASLKTLYEIIVLPLTILIVNWLKNKETQFNDSYQ